jgi:hypothetical protein
MPGVSEPLRSAASEPAAERVPGAVDADMLEKCRRLAALPANAPGADKTWVLLQMRAIQKLLSAPQPIPRKQQIDAMIRARDALKRG